MRVIEDVPEGSYAGLQNCPVCLGTGRIDVVSDNPVPQVQVCECAMLVHIASNVNRGWKGLFNASKVPDSPLKACTKQSAWITAEREVFRAHLRHVAVRQGPNWMFRVVSDADLMTAWLGSTVVKRAEIYDPDVSSSKISGRYHDLVDLVIPHELLVIYLGVKTARNAAMPEVLVEALLQREYEGKPTWVCDQPSHPFDPSHLCYSESAVELMADFKRHKIGVETKQITIDPIVPRKTPIQIGPDSTPKKNMLSRFTGGK